MNIKNIVVTSLCICFVLFPAVGNAETNTTNASSLESLLAKIKILMAQVEELQQKIAATKSEISLVLRSDLREGMTDEEIRRIQELLATDPTIYPEGLATGYFGPLTKEALKRFQKKFNLEITGEINEETKSYLEELLKERFGEKVPPGLLSAPGILKKIELRLKDGCDNAKKGSAPFCKELKEKLGDMSDSDDDNNKELE